MIAYHISLSKRKEKKEILLPIFSAILSLSSNSMFKNGMRLRIGNVISPIPPLFQEVEQDIKAPFTSTYHNIFVGKPAAVSNLTSANLTKVIYLTWEAPFTLDITGVDPDISYCVDIRAVAVADSNDSTPLTTNYSVYLPEFNFTMDYPNTSTSVIYEFQVIPRNGAGEGPTSAPVYGFFSGRELWWLWFYRTDWNGTDMQVLPHYVAEFNHMYIHCALQIL